MGLQVWVGVILQSPITKSSRLLCLLDSLDLKLSESSPNVKR